ncbi:hypothetical protein GCM10027343_38330 [Noviherbaspirillum agri]
MPFGIDIGRVLGQYTGANAGQQFPRVEQDFDDVASNSPQEHLRDGVSEAFRSDQTPPFGNMVAQMFSQGDAGQRTGMVNHLLSALGPGAIASVLGSGAASGVLGGLLTRAGGQQQVQLTQDEAQQLSPDEVQALASRAEQENPGIIDHMSNFYANNPTLVKALGGAALAIALGKMAQRK